MTDQGEFDRLLAANDRYAESFPHSSLTAAPVRSLVIVTCMDARLDVLRAMGLAMGDAHIIRNAGGLATDDVIRSLIVSQQLLGTHEIVVIDRKSTRLNSVTRNNLVCRLLLEKKKAHV